MTDISSTEVGATAVGATAAGATATIAAEASADPHSGPHGYMSNKDAYLKRLRRIEGQARGLQGMVADDKYCIDILTQVSAMTSALQAVALGLLNDHLSHCVVEAAVKGGDEADAKVKEAFDAIARLVRS
ncbi:MULTISPECIES: metal-sensitive transcriptional regulator [unclassified Cryobacterium]|uniref:metal-sensitive transcriptional regulator n=1 Tax=unclassified Cryobacterium TaxID=2649013 RepID=UPI00106BBEB0|nr:transcriptional regulator [Cryobacterium sp. MDB2-A-1]TFC07857.1 transcriptional regulator [Cryobacterium sp. MDB2-A-2]TFC11468.1 transcriptional regulator [Cryobacterium sp. MDB2-33-2]TFC21089.1 transcriptional regulator [Cryobacterium sp. MDB2-10]TFC32336.1 transcriptional regulator [Cryobacterium sp. MDB1-18-2]TFC46061.1 transcriptional regulator [Cryobacterium sp. MDB1-18-1]